MSSFTIDNVTPSIFEQLGQQKIIELSTNFYNRVYEEDVNNKNSEYFDCFGVFFVDRPIDESIQNQYEFFIQRFGGPPLYSNRKGHPALRGRHRNFKITTKAADRWIYHMENTLNSINITKEQIEILLEFLKHVAYFLRNTHE